MSREIPPLPDAVTALSADILAELLDSEHVLRVHGRRTCYTAGCRGPLCRRADRIENRRRYEESRRRAGKPFTPSDLRTVRDSRDEELDLALEVYSEHARVIEIYVRLKKLYEELGGAPLAEAAG
jgi:hypothetical protein